MPSVSMVIIMSDYKEFINIYSLYLSKRHLSLSDILNVHI